MPTKQQVWLVADRLRAKAERVSLRSVRAALPRGGSYRDIGGHLAAWKAERVYQPGIELARLPERLQTELAGFGAAVWEAAMQLASRQFDAERKVAEEVLGIERQLREEALMSADVLEARVTALQAQVSSLQRDSDAAQDKASGAQVDGLY